MQRKRFPFGRVRLVAAAVLLAGFVTLPALAHKGAHGIVKQRMKAMMRMEKDLRPINAMLRGKRPFDAQLVHERGQRILRHAERIPQLFPQGSLQPASEASPLIWKDFDDFRRRAERLEAAALLLMQASAATLPDIARQVQAACRGCHEKYRIEKD